MVRRKAQKGEILMVVRLVDGVWSLANAKRTELIDLPYNSEVRFLRTTPRAYGRNVVKWISTILQRNTDPDWMLATWRHVKLPDGESIAAFCFGDRGYAFLTSCRPGQMLKVIETGIEFKKPFSEGAAP